MHYSRKNVLILGLAREGESLARFLAAQGACVTVTDSAPIEQLQARVDSIDDQSVRFALGGDFPELAVASDAVFVSPGVPDNNPVYRAAQTAGVPLESMTRLFFELCRGRIVGITGSSGKTTTTGLVGHILATAHRDCVVGGNIGAPMLDLLPAIGPATVVVLELSSFQLELLGCSPHLAVVTNISPNHLDRHGSMDRYIRAKRNVVAHQTADDHAVLNASDPEAAAFGSVTPASISWFAQDIGAGAGACIRNGSVGVTDGATFQPVMPVTDIPLLGTHNIENVLAALATGRLLEIDPAVMATAIREYRPPSHRLETIGEKRGVRFVDDSIATSPARAAVALQAISNPVILIAGGRDKKLPWDDFARLAARKARALVLIGEAAAQIESAVRSRLDDGGALAADAIRHCPSLCSAVREAAAIARAGDVVLLSPGCTSYDMFRDFEERGDMFARAVEALDAA